jgi:hypothetical protein
MPFKSKAQRDHLRENLPDVAKQLEAETPPGMWLPDRVRGTKPRAVHKATNATRSAILKAGKRR